MSSLNVQNIVSATALEYGGGHHHGPFCTVEVKDDRGFSVSLFLGPDLGRAKLVAETIKLAMPRKDGGRYD